MAAVMIGVDPHKGSHTAVAIGTAEEVLGQVRVRACDAQAGQLLAWAAAWPERTWAVEGAGTFWEERRGQFIDPFGHRQGVQASARRAARRDRPGSGEGSRGR
jgi:uncharacterized glyoxalase superfamily protein PhnB